ncbi:M48 family metalloprotease [Roseiconus lacunae]|uniref:M48 family metalloprotease n=1 Tax=Roseiconus lacunae TaxID=2605694 RepID=A0ABT7PIK4_9BACT|nr:M48 family metalloprotease [Roseiconus lacunae]MCD0461195.1 M48 family metalloprotease [Roseiconus lacunae]MDM4016021.1 M48 family metalloprotease [Roseiconus lacunae]
MQLYYFLAVVISLSFGTLPQPGANPAIDLERSVAFSAAVVGVWWVMCFLCGRLVLNLVRQGEITVDTAFDWFGRQTTCLRWLSLAIIGLCLGGFGLGRCLDQLPVVSQSMTLHAIGLLLPTVAILLGLWSAEHRFAQRLGVARSGFRSAVAWLALMARSTIAWIVVPILLMLVLVDIASIIPLSPGTRIGLLILTMIAASVFVMPWLVRRAFPQTSIDEATSSWIHQVLQAAGLKRCKLIIWDTKQRSFNAMMAGFFGRFQIVFLTDRLVRDLSRPQLAMVILHEVAHARRKHALIRVLALAPAWLGGLAIQASVGVISPSDTLIQWAPMIGNTVSLAATVCILRQVSYFCEFDADSVACQLAPEVCWPESCVPASVEEAGRTLSSALVKVTDGCEGARRPSWLHPGVSQRIDAVLA